MSARLSQKEIEKRLIRLTNLERLHEEDQETKKNLRKQVKDFEEIINLQDNTINTLEIRIAELEKMIFGGKPPKGGNASSAYTPPKKKKKKRSKDSYKRAVPENITHEEYLTLPDDCTCGGVFEKEIHVRYTEDIPLPELTKDYTPVITTKYTIEKGICTSCKQKKTANDFDLGGSHVRLGRNIRLLISSLITKDGLSYDQVISLVSNLYQMDISSGEITRILTRQHERWLKDYERLKDTIRQSKAIHLDETPWKLQEEKLGYLWVMADAFSHLVAFVFADSRGKGHAQKLIGESDAIGITDGYSCYASILTQQQLCWAHLYRTSRDLRYNKNLKEIHRPYVTQWYEQFSAIYKELQHELEKEYVQVIREGKAQELWERLETLATEQNNEPHKLTKLKEQLQKAGKDKLFLCLIEDIPCDNNRAERELRPLVIKRKRSFGSKTKQGALALSTITSLCVSTWRESRKDYFLRLSELG